LIDLVDPPTAWPLSRIHRISCHDLFDRTGSERTRKGRQNRLLDLDSGATIVFTSGSSGLPKAALHSVSNHYFSALGSNRNIQVGPETRWLLSLPLYHVGGLGIIFRTTLGGGAMVVPPAGKDLNSALATHRVTHLSLVATQLQRLLDGPMDMAVGNRLSAVLVGGGPTAAGWITRAYDSGIPVYKTYGLTEMASQVTTTGPGEERGRLSTSGKVLDYRCVKIDGGEICVKGKTLFKGYIDADGLDLPLDKEGWFRTGDLGEMDGDGYLSLLGRKDNMFISGGENIHCEEIEAAIHRLPGLLQAVVVPVEDQDFGARPVAFVRFNRDKAISHDEMVARLENDIPRFKIPIAFFDCPEAKGRFKPDRKYLSRLARKRLIQT
jgi:O-succinylbenzoic acid--CoA ligase